MYKQLQGNVQQAEQGNKQQDLALRLNDKVQISLASGLEVKGREGKRRKQTKCKQINRSTTAELVEGVGDDLPYTYQSRDKVS